MFNNKLFKQFDGMAMGGGGGGSPLGPLFANFFLGFLEQNYFTERNNVKPTFYVHYVDDTFVLFNDRSHIEQFVAYLKLYRYANIQKNFQ